MLTLSDEPTNVTEETSERPSRHILLAIYEFVPIGDAQIIRWANLIHFMAEQNQRITVLAGSFPECGKPQDPSMLDVIDHPNINVVRVPMEICDPGRMTIIEWSRRAYRKAIELNQETPFDVVLTSALPIYAHGIGHALRLNGHIPYWLADYGDPWSTSRTLGQGRIKKAIEMVIERRILRLADAVTITTDAALEAFLPLYDQPERIAVVPMGASYFHMRKNWTKPPRTLLPDDTLQLLYPGSFYRTREPDKLFEGLAQVDNVRLHIVGRHHIDMVGRAEKYGVEEQVTLTPYTTQRQIVNMQETVDVLLLTSWPVPEQLSGKFYEYLMTNKPILYVTNHERDLASDIMRERGIGKICDHTPEAIAAALHELVIEAREGRLPNRTPQYEYGFDMRARAYLDVIEQVMA